MDPFVAIGYRYAIGAGNPNFGSVLLPAVQNECGVGAFDVTGIDPAAGLAPGNVTAFLTGLTVVTDGDFTGTMTALIEDLEATPEPATLLLLGSTAAVGFIELRRRKRS